MSPKFIQALKSLGAQHLTQRHHAQPIIEQQPIPSSSSSIPTTVLNILQDLLSDIQYTLSDIKLSIKQSYISLQDKSQSEILFLIAILLTVLLFVVILPIYEAIIATDDEEVNEIRKKVEKEVPQSAPLKMYKPGVGIVEVTYDSPSLLRMSSSSDTSNSSSGSDRSLNGSICTHHSLETIEESEEEYLLLQDDEQESEEEDRVPGLDITAVDDDEEEEEEETVDDKVKYYEFLSFCNSDDD